RSGFARGVLRSTPVAGSDVLDANGLFGPEVTVRRDSCTEQQHQACRGRADAPDRAPLRLAHDVVDAGSELRGFVIVEMLEHHASRLPPGAGRSGARPGDAWVFTVPVEHRN